MHFQQLFDNQIIFNVQNIEGTGQHLIPKPHLYRLRLFQGATIRISGFRNSNKKISHR